MLFMLLKNVRLNDQTNLYEVTEATIKYQIDPSLLKSLQTYFQDNPYLLFANWYRTLDEAEKEKVNRTGGNV